MKKNEHIPNLNSDYDNYGTKKSIKRTVKFIDRDASGNIVIKQFVKKNSDKKGKFVVVEKIPYIPTTKKQVKLDTKNIILPLLPIKICSKGKLLNTKTNRCVKIKKEKNTKLKNAILEFLKKK